MIYNGCHESASASMPMPLHLPMPMPMPHVDLWPPLLLKSFNHNSIFK